jgi:hypothetical protein
LRTTSLSTVTRGSRASSVAISRGAAAAATADFASLRDPAPPPLQLLDHLQRRLGLVVETDSKCRAEIGERRRRADGTLSN